jgi:hypothetical protein
MFKLRANNEKLFILFFLFLALNMSIVNDVQAQKEGKIKTVVIDAGHGGKDPGAIGMKSKEKDITLSVAKKTGDYIKQTQGVTPASGCVWQLWKGDSNKDLPVGTTPVEHGATYTIIYKRLK